MGDLQPSLSFPPQPARARRERGDRNIKDCSCLSPSHWLPPGPRKGTGGWGNGTLLARGCSSVVLRDTDNHALCKGLAESAGSSQEGWCCHCLGYPGSSPGMVMGLGGLNLQLFQPVPCLWEESHREVLSLGWPLVWPGMKARYWVQGQSDATGKNSILKTAHKSLLSGGFSSGFWQSSEQVLVADEAFPSFHRRQYSCPCHRLLKALDWWHHQVTFVDITLGGINLSFLISLNLLSHLNLAIIDLFCL